MRTHLNTLFVNSQGAYLKKDGETILIRLEGKNIFRVPVHTLEGIVCFGRVSCSPSAMDLCGQYGITISFLSLNGRFRARVIGPVKGNVILRRQQYRTADDHSQSLEISRVIILAKIVNSRAVIMRFLRDHTKSAGKIIL